MTPSQTQDVFRVLTLDTSAERLVGALRLAAAVLTLAAALWLGSLAPPLRMWIFIGLGGLVAAFWVMMWRRARRHVREAPHHYVALEPEALRRAAGSDERTVPWAQVTGVVADEERLVVRVNVEGEDDLALEPSYGGLGMYELEAAVTRAWDTARQVRPGPTVPTLGRPEEER